ncbi:MAG TPA: translation elongation factor Ts [Fimbriiglobus sp.]
MSAISAAAVNELRKRTDLPLMECKKALSETGGDLDKAVELLRTWNAKAAVKREGNEVAEGRVGIYVEPAAETAAIAELRCESAPSTKSDQFIELTYDIARQVASAAPETVEQLLAQSYSNGKGTVKDRIDEVVGLIREKMIVHRFERVKAPVFGSYVHHDGTVGTLIACTGKPTGPTDEVLKDICAHVSALNPLYQSPVQVPAEVIAKEKAFILQQIKDDPKNAGKPANIMDKIADGKLKTWMAETVMTEQPMANTGKYPNTTVGQVLTKLGLTPVRVIRYKVGAMSV